jgi:tight adherence protein B
MSHALIMQLIIAALTFGSVALLVLYASAPLKRYVDREMARYDRVLNRQLLLGVAPSLALGMALGIMLLVGMALMVLTSSWIGFVLGAGLGYLVPALVVRHLEQKRKEHLDAQLVDGIMTLASGVRAGLTLLQAIEVLVSNHVAPIKQEFAQLLREYQMGMDLNQAMRNTSDRIGLQNYRLLFTAIEMHRVRGGNTGESLDRIAESIREIQRLEGKLDALTAQGRSQAWMMAAMSLVIIVIYYFIDPQGVKLLFTEPIGRILLLLAALLIAGGFLWIRRILQVDI